MTMVANKPYVHWNPTLSRFKQGFAVAWPELRDDRQQVLLASYSPTLELVGGPIQLSSARATGLVGAGSSNPAVGEVGDFLLVVWPSDGEQNIDCGGNRQVLALARVASCE
jgi:hypothetical protein